MTYRDPLDEPLLQLSEEDFFRFRDAVQNVFVTGVTGGGKTSGPGLNILKSLAESRCGGIVLCAKPGEADEVRKLYEELGLSQSLIVWTGREHGFNFLGYALARMGADGINGVTEYLLRVIEMIRGASAMPGTNGDAFWLDALRVLLRHSLPVVYAATGTLRIADILAFVRGAPTSPEQLADPDWQRQGSCFVRFFTQAASTLDDETGSQVASYWKDDFARMDGKLRSNIVAGFSMLDRFNHGWLRDSFCKDTSIVPALCFHGVTIVLDMPRATLGEDGVIAQMIFKDAWQVDVLARNALPPVHRERFVFCYADECQEVVASSDAAFLAMSRSSRASTIYLTQSLPGLYSKLGGPTAHDRAHHLIASMGVRIHCANSCAETNEWASRSIGKAVQRRASFNENQGTNTNFGANMGEGTNHGTNSGSGGSSSYSSGPNGGSHSSGNSWSNGRSDGYSDNWGRNRGHGSSQGTSWGYSEVVDDILPAGFFTRGLKTGGPATNFRVSAVLHQVGRCFVASGGPSLLVEFRQ
jgi:hypothetical protein